MPVQTNNCVMLAVHFWTITKIVTAKATVALLLTLYASRCKLCENQNKWKQSYLVFHLLNDLHVGLIDASIVVQTLQKKSRKPLIASSDSTATRQQYPVHTKITGKNSLKMSFKNVPHLIVFPGENLILFVTKLSEDGLRKTTWYLTAIKYDTREYPASKNFAI